jgi:hypothetical protein
MNSFLPLAVLLALAPPNPPPFSPQDIRAATEPTLDAPVSAKIYYPVVVTLKDAGKTTQVKWKITPTPVWSEKLTTGVGFRFTGPPAKYHYTALYVDFDAKLFGELEGETEIVGTVPVPPPIDPPPPPLDPDFARVQAAYLTDTPLDPMQRKNAAIDLANYYRDASAICRMSKATTAGALYNEIASIKIPATAILPKVRAIVSPELRKVIPINTPADSAITDATRTTMAETFEKYSRLVEAASRG